MKFNERGDPDVIIPILKFLWKIVEVSVIWIWTLLTAWRSSAETGRSSPLNLSAEFQELQKLLDETVRLYEVSPFGSETAADIADSLVLEIFRSQDIRLTKAQYEPLYNFCCAMLSADNLWEKPNFAISNSMALSEQTQLKKKLHHLEKIYRHGEQAHELVTECVYQIVYSLLQTLPKQNQEVDQSECFQIPASILVDDSEEYCHWLMTRIFSEGLMELDLFWQMRKTIDLNLCEVSGIDPDLLGTTNKKAVFPEESKLIGTALFSAYLKDTPFLAAAERPTAFHIPISSRMEHTHILAGSGFGKTQTLQNLMLQDINAGRGFMVIDSQEDLIREISSLAVFGPGGAMEGKLVMVDPTDIEYPPALNLFALGDIDTSDLSPLHREMLINGTVEIYSYFFNVVFDAELTQRQGALFTYIARLMIEIPNANIDTLRDLLENGEKYRPYMNRLSGTGKAFFETQFFSKNFTAVKIQLLERLWSVFANSSFERSFSAKKNKVDLFSAMQEGKVVLINTAKGLLEETGSATFGRFFITLLVQATIRRSSIPKAERRDFIVYIDEAHEYLDNKVKVLLEQARKYRVGINISHQFLDQLPTSVREAIFALTTVKLAGGISASDATKLSGEIRASKEMLLSTKKHEDDDCPENNHSFFCLWIKNRLPGAVIVKTPFGLLDHEPVLDSAGRQAVKDTNRKNYCICYDDLNREPVDTETSSAPLLAPNSNQRPAITLTPEKPQAGQNEPVLEGRGGANHKEIQQQIKRIGLGLGFGVEVEATCKTSKGAMDVLLKGEHSTIAVEVSMTTSAEHEFENLKKCLVEDPDWVLCVSPDETHRLEIQNLALENLSHKEAQKIKYLHPNAVERFLTQFDERPAQKIRGFEVVTMTVPSDPETLSYRKKRLKRVLDAHK